MATRKVRVPGDESSHDDLGPVVADAESDPKDVEIANLKQQLAMLAAKPAQGAATSMTTTELMAEIDAGRMQEPFMNMLCSDGWYTTRKSQPAKA